MIVSPAAGVEGRKSGWGGMLRARFVREKVLWPRRGTVVVVVVACWRRRDASVAAGLVNVLASIVGYRL